MEKILEFVGHFPNGLISKLSLIVCVFSFIIFAIIGITQFLKNKNGIYNFKTEFLSIIVSVLLYAVLYVLWLTVFKRAYVFYEMFAVLIVSIFSGVFASLVAEKLFRQKK